MNGFVSFVGAGPGAKELITEQGSRRLKEADVILYDRLVNPRLLRSTKNSCELIYCGKLPTQHLMRQEQINETLVEHAAAGKKVVRLKGGDPSIFGRVGEEAKALHERGIEYEIVPGITASIAAANYAGIPVTHRDHSTSVTLRTGHALQEENTESYLRNDAGDTIVYYMGVKNLQHHCEELIKAGHSPDLGTAVVEWATTGKQRTVEGTLTTIAEEVEKHRIQNPAVTIIGNVVQLRKELHWFEKKRMFGRKLLIAKASPEESKLEDYFLEQGAEAYAFPSLKLIKQTFSDSVLQRARAAEKLLFLAPESVTIFLEAFYARGHDIRDLSGRIYCLSEKTKKLLQQSGLRAEKMKAADRDMVQIGYRQADKGAARIETHTISMDNRFREIDREMLEEAWDTVIFPSRSAVDWFIQAAAEFESEHLMNLSFAHLGESVKAYAQSCGFHRVDEEVQEELTRWRKS